MNAADFELNVAMPADARFAETMRDLAVHAARYAGCVQADADRYGAAVQAAVRGCVDRVKAGTPVPVIFRRGGGPLECLIGCEARFEAATPEGRISVGWTREQGTAMCRVALECDLT